MDGPEFQTISLEQPVDDTENQYPFSVDAATAEVVVDPSVPDHFSVRDSNSASWVVRRIAEARSYAARVKHWGEREIKHARHDEQFFMMRYGQQLQDWATSEITRFRGRRRSVNLPAGTIGFRRSGPILVINDEEAVIAWALTTCPEAIIETRRVSKTALYTYLEKTGEIPNGINLLAEQDRFYIK